MTYQRLDKMMTHRQYWATRWEQGVYLVRKGEWIYAVYAYSIESAKERAKKEEYVFCKYHSDGTIHLLMPYGQSEWTLRVQNSLAPDGFRYVIRGGGIYTGIVQVEDYRNHVFHKFEKASGLTIYPNGKVGAVSGDPDAQIRAHERKRRKERAAKRKYKSVKGDGKCRVGDVVQLKHNGWYWDDKTSTPIFRPTIGDPLIVHRIMFNETTGSTRYVFRDLATKKLMPPRTLRYATIVRNDFLSAANQAVMRFNKKKGKKKHDSRVSQVPEGLSGSVGVERPGAN